MDKEKKDFFRNILLNNCKKVGSCIEWTGKTNQGYGYIQAFKKTWLVHRVSYMTEIGDIPEGFYILHKCNNKKCFNPHHIYLGTAKENSEDLLNSDYYEDVIEKTWQNKKENREYTKSHTLSPDSQFFSIEDVAKIFDVHPHTIRRAIRKGFIQAIRIGEGIKSPYRISKKSIENIHTTLLLIQTAKPKQIG